MDFQTRENLVVALDIGTSKIVCLIADIAPDGEIQVLGFGKEASRGMKQGQVNNIETTAEAIRKAVSDAEKMSRTQVNSVYVGIAGSHITSLNTNGVVAIKDWDVTDNDVERVLEISQVSRLADADQMILHLIKQEFEIDGLKGIRNPVGLHGISLSGNVHVVKGDEHAVQNISKCIRRCDLEVAEIVLEQLASSLSALSEDERELGVCLVDIGGGTTDLAIITDGAVRFTANLPCAGDSVTNDIARSLSTPVPDASDIKVKYGCAMSELVRPEEYIKVPSIGDRPERELMRQTLAEVVQARYEELMIMIRDKIEDSGLKYHLASGVVLTGGTAKMEGVVELAERVLEMPVRVAGPEASEKLDEFLCEPEFSTAVGLLMYARDHRSENSPAMAHTLDDHIPEREKSDGIVKKLSNWMKDAF
ncbi:MAG: cell division protein FtsA [Pontibacterium sp.]